MHSATRRQLRARFQAPLLKPPVPPALPEPVWEQQQQAQRQTRGAPHPQPPVAVVEGWQQPEEEQGPQPEQAAAELPPPVLEF